MTADIEHQKKKIKTNQIAASNSRETKYRIRKLSFKQEIEMERQYYSAGEDIVEAEIKLEAALELEISKSSLRNFTA